MLLPPAAAIKVATVAETAANAPDFPADPAESGYNPVLYSVSRSLTSFMYFRLVS